MPQENLIDTYIYLAKRDKRGVRILYSFLSQNHIPERLKSIKNFPFDPGLKSKIEQVVYQERFIWEPWIESAKTYDELRLKLKKRGFSNIPMSSQPELTFQVQVLDKISGKKVMVQKTSQ